MLQHIALYFSLIVTVHVNLESATLPAMRSEQHTSFNVPHAWLRPRGVRVVSQCLSMLQDTISVCYNPCLGTRTLACGPVDLLCIRLQVCAGTSCLLRSPDVLLLLTFCAPYCRSVMAQAVFTEALMSFPPVGLCWLKLSSQKP